MGDGLRVRVLGAVSPPVAGARLQTLLVRLALAGGRTVSQAALVDAIWPEDPPAAPAHALQALVSRLRRALGDAGAVQQAAGGYRLVADEVDALRFEQLAAQGRDRLRAGDPAAAALVLAEAADLWGDHPEAGPGAIAAVAPAVATRLARLAVEAAADLAEAELALGRPDDAATRLTGLLAEQPAHERAAGLLMDALAAQGRQAEALAVYEQVREALADRLGADPGEALRDRHLDLLRGDSYESPPNRSAGAGENSNLPSPVTSFIGRDEDLARIDALLATGRLVTVVGTGGAGKTRLAVEAARRRTGVRMIDLAAVTEPAKVAAAVLTGIGVRGAMFDGGMRADGDELDTLVDRLGGGETLLVVDNCEHLIDAVAHLLSALLVRCAGLTVLATSREPLAIDGEALVPLGPLALPEADADVEQARRTASIVLFAERAAAVQPGFAVTDHNLADVLRVVRGLDGLPLALELAAARLRTLALPELAAGLDDRFRLLTTGSRTALPRHRTLRAVIAWSWDLLSADERTVAERVSILPGGVTTASATALREGTPVPAAEVPELLAALVDRSLLQLAPGGRYRMLETLREYGIERLSDPFPVRDQAARHFAALVARQDPLLRGRDQLGAIRVLGAEYDNILAALRHLCDTGDAIGLAVDLTWYWQMFGRQRDAAYWLGQAVTAPGARSGAERDVAEAVLLLNTMADQNPATAESFQELPGKLRALTERLLSYDELPGFGGTLVAIRLATLVDSDASPAIVERLADGPDVWLAGLARMFRAQAAESAGHLDRVREDVPVALESFRAAGDRWGLAATLPLRALLRQYDGDLAGAATDLGEAKRLAREFGSLSLSDEIFIDLRWIDLRIRLGQTAPAYETIAAARERALRSRSPEMALLLDAREADLRLRDGDPTRAGELLDAAEAELARFTYGADHGLALVGSVRAALCLALGDGPGAASSLEQAYVAAVESGDMPVLATVAVNVAALAELYGRYAETATILGAAARLRGAHDPAEPQVHALSERGRSELGDEAFGTAYGKGWEMDRQAAVTQVDPRRLGAHLR